MSAEQRLRDGLHEAARRVDVAPRAPAAIEQRARQRRSRRRVLSAFGTVAVLIGVAIAATTVGGIDVPGVEVAGHPDGTREITIFLCDGRECESISDDQRQKLAGALEREASVLDVTYESKAEAYDRFLGQFADQPDFTDGVTADDLPASFRVLVDLSGDVQGFVDRYGARAGVEDVVVMPEDSADLDGQGQDVPGHVGAGDR